MRFSLLVQVVGVAVAVLVSSKALAICEASIDFSGKWSLTESGVFFEDSYTIAILKQDNKVTIRRVKVDSYDYDSENISYGEMETYDRVLSVIGEHPARGSFALKVNFDPALETFSGTIKYGGETDTKNVSGKRSNSAYAARQETRIECFERSTRDLERLLAKAYADRDRALEQLRNETAELNKRLVNETGRLQTLFDSDKSMLTNRAKEEREVASNELELATARAEKFRNSAELLNVNVDKLTSITTNLSGQVGSLRIQLKTAKANLAVEQKRPPRIFSEPLSKDYAVGTETTIKSRPKKTAKALVIVKRGTVVANIAELVERGWALIATKDGIIGYVPSDILIRRRRASTLPIENVAQQSQTSPQDQSIVIDSPNWDKGQRNKIMTLPSGGFVSLFGHVNSNAGLKSLTVNKLPADLLGGNTFGASLSIHKASNYIKIIAVDKKGKVMTHEFTINVTSP
jgi:hypothetical protein